MVTLVLLLIEGGIFTLAVAFPGLAKFDTISI
jgi:hypothetical protein